MVKVVTAAKNQSTLKTYYQNGCRGRKVFFKRGDYKFPRRYFFSVFLNILWSNDGIYQDEATFFKQLFFGNW